MDWTVDPAADAPPWRQLVQKVLDALASGELEAGEALLSVRKMAASALVNANTVARAYRELEQQGITSGQNGRGVFVTPEGPELARTNRQEATWTALRDAWQAALRSGHTPTQLTQALQRWASTVDEDSSKRKPA